MENNTANKIRGLEKTIDTLIKEIDFLQKRENQLENALEEMYRWVPNQFHDVARAIYNKAEIRIKND